MTNENGLSKRNAVVIGFESTCDDTGVAIVDNNNQILANQLHSQMKRHLWNGGIIPMLAKELHVEEIDNVALRALQESKLGSVSDNIDAIAISNRPGLYHSIKVGLNYATTLAQKYSKPLIPIHHMQAHALMPLLEHKQIRFPYLTLLISGGHCILAVAKRFDNFHILGQSTDDAPGDLLDKFARRTKLRNLGSPFDNMSGGAAIELLARTGDRYRYFNTEPVIPKFKHKTCNFSFSGYRGCYEPLLPKIDDLWLQGDRPALMREISDMCASLQRVVLIQLVRRIQRAMAYFRMYWRYENEDAFLNVSNSQHLGYGLLKQDYDMTNDCVDLLVSGGVAANNYIIEGIRNICSESLDSNIQVYSPRKDLCNDNGLMIAWNGLLHYRNYLQSGDTTTVQFNSQEFKQIDALPVDPMGVDLTSHIRSANFDLKGMKHDELKIGKDGR